jgi:sulfoacetaldehyde dehydrogenase
MAERTITAEEQQTCSDLIQRARAAMKAAEAFDQATSIVCAARWPGPAATKPAPRAGGDERGESGMGSPEPSRRGKVLGILRDALRQKSMGVIEELPEKGIVNMRSPQGSWLRSFR